MTIQTVAKGRQYTVASESKPGTLYVVIVNAGETSCDCPAGIHRPDRQCKHQRAVAAKVEAERKPAFNLAPGLALLTGKAA